MRSKRVTFIASCLQRFRICPAITCLLELGCIWGRLKGSSRGSIHFAAEAETLRTSRGDGMGHAAFILSKPFIGVYRFHFRLPSFLHILVYIVHELNCDSHIENWKDHVFRLPAASLTASRVAFPDSKAVLSYHGFCRLKDHMIRNLYMQYGPYRCP